eukprot:1265-Pyramimonas_sp.AAC.1
MLSEPGHPTTTPVGDAPLDARGEQSMCPSRKVDLPVGPTPRQRILGSVKRCSRKRTAYA